MRNYPRKVDCRLLGWGGKIEKGDKLVNALGLSKFVEGQSEWTCSRFYFVPHLD